MSATVPITNIFGGGDYTVQILVGSEALQKRSSSGVRMWRVFVCGFGVVGFPTGEAGLSGGSKKHTTTRRGLVRASVSIV